MVDFKKRLGTVTIEKKINPIEIYDTLDRKSLTGPLRPAQIKVLNEWFTNRIGAKDLIIKLHTGEGKTLIGLLILQSKLNSGSGPCLFICPNKYLVEQVYKDAKKFGIKVCIIEPDGSIPNEFIDGERILVTHVQKVFNGLTMFGLNQDYLHVENVVLDDSHACIDSIRKSFTISINRADFEDTYNKIHSLFKDDLVEQGHGTALEIENGEFDSLLPIPYWNWIEKCDEVTQILSDKRNEIDEIRFGWPLLKDNLKNCQAFISGHFIEITPIHVPIEKFSSFSRASQRVLMSATTQDDSFFVKGLGFDIEAIKSPLTDSEQIWSGEKMIVIPSLIDESLNREKIVNLLGIPSQKNYGVVALVGSFQKSQLYNVMDSTIAKASDISAIIKDLKSGNYERTVVFVNRYDGIDLPDEKCRILLIDGKPFFNSLSDRYEESNRINSDLINIKIAQKIEQGLGRGVRGEKDYCLIIIVGDDLVKFIKNSRTKKYFSSQTQKQIEIGLKIAQMGLEEIDDSNEPFEVVKALMQQSLKRDEGWKEYYQSEMKTIAQSVSKNALYKQLTLERNASEKYEMGDYEAACDIIQKLISECCDDDSERAWFLQIMARYKFELSKTDSNLLQKSAFQLNRELLKPREGVTYRKLSFINENRIIRIQNWINAHSDYEDMMLSIQGVLADLTFGVNSEKFEIAMKQIGSMLGFLSERPDKEIKKGPDNLWCGVGDQYFIFECKSEVLDTRESINKNEASQMNTHCGWFEEVYGSVNVKRVLIIPTKNLHYQGNFTHEVEIMRKGSLRSLKNNIISFYKELKNYDLKSISDETIHDFLSTHKLDVQSLKSEYSEPYFHKKN